MNTKVAYKLTSHLPRFAILILKKLLKVKGESSAIEQKFLAENKILIVQDFLGYATRKMSERAKSKNV